jgi:hypothetical protein
MDRAETQPRGLRVSVGCVTFPPCRTRSRTHSFERMMPAGGVGFAAAERPVSCPA